MKKVILFATVFAFAVSTMFAQQSTGTTTPTPAKKSSNEMKKDTTKKDGKAPVKKVPSKKKTSGAPKK